MGVNNAIASMLEARPTGAGHKGKPELKADRVIETSPGTWQVRLAGQLLPHMWNSEAAACAGPDVERRRLKNRRERAFREACRELIYGAGADTSTQRVIDLARFALGEDRVLHVNGNRPRGNEQS